MADAPIQHDVPAVAEEGALPETTVLDTKKSGEEYAVVSVSNKLVILQHPDGPKFSATFEDVKGVEPGKTARITYEEVFDNIPVNAKVTSVK